jgi:hypothetical protein
VTLLKLTSEPSRRSLGKLQARAKNVKDVAA